MILSKKSAEGWKGGKKKGNKKGTKILETGGWPKGKSFKKNKKKKKKKQKKKRQFVFWRGEMGGWG